ncbi:MAG: hypothetical protein KKF62_00310 [Bacteroidetes bacterium]|nr:hypothetical protein [Bacteroidota bacterium]
MLLTLSALVLLSLVVLRVLNGFLNTNSILMETKFGVLGVSLATSILEEAMGKAFDETTANSGVAYATTDLSSIGSDGEIYPNFDDFDDFNNLNFSTYDTTIESNRFAKMYSAEYLVNCTVGYINPASPNQFSASKTWHKKITVQITTPSSKDTISMSTVYSYFYYR